MVSLGSYVRFLIGILLVIEIFRIYLTGGNVSIIPLILSFIFSLMFLLFLVEKDMSGIKSYIRFFILLLIAINIFIGFSFDLVFLIAFAFIISSVEFFVRFL